MKHANVVFLAGQRPYSGSPCCKALVLYYGAIGSMLLHIMRLSIVCSSALPTVVHIIALLQGLVSG